MEIESDNADLQPDCLVMNCGFRVAHPNLKKKYKSLEDDYDELQSKIEEMELLLTEGNKDMKPGEKQQLNGKILGLGRKISLLEKSVGEKTAEIEEYKHKAIRVEAEYKKYREEFEAIKTEVQLNEEYQEKMDAIKLADKTINEKNLELNRVNKLIELGSKRKEDLQLEHDAVTESYNETASELKKIKELYNHHRKVVGKFAKKEKIDLYDGKNVVKKKKGFFKRIGSWL